MRRVILSVMAAAMLAGCSLFKPDKYDGAEFVVYAEAWQWGQRLDDSCGRPAAEASAHTGLYLIAERARLFGLYGLYADSKAYAEGLGKVVNEFKPGGSLTYCRATAENIRTAAETAMRQIGRRDR
mgnify:CR=1 FL=1